MPLYVSTVLHGNRFSFGQATFDRESVVGVPICKMMASSEKDKSTNIMVRFGIVGFGLHAVRRLMPGFALARSCRVTALSRRDMAKARESAEHYKIPLAFDSAAGLVPIIGSGRRAGDHTELAPPSRRPDRHRPRETRTVRKADGHERQRMPADGRSRARSRRPAGRGPGVSLRRQYGPSSRSPGSWADRSSHLRSFGIFVSRRNPSAKVVNGSGPGGWWPNRRRRACIASMRCALSFRMKLCA